MTLHIMFLSVRLLAQDNKNYCPRFHDSSAKYVHPCVIKTLERVVCKHINNRKITKSVVKVQNVQSFTGPPLSR